MTTRTQTIAVLVVATLGLIGWDIYVALTPQKGDTISEILLETAGTVSALPAALGFLMGHLFWPRKHGGFRLGGTLAAVLAFGLRDVLAYSWPLLAVSWWPIVALLLGVVLGHYCWAQRLKTPSELISDYQQTFPNKDVPRPTP
jgi:hypothetical protein